MSVFAAAKASVVPEGTAGPWTIERVTPTEADVRFESLRAVFNGGGRGRVAAGEPITMLRHVQRGIVMSDTPDEMRDLWPFVHALSQYNPKRVLINGLGLGCVVRLALAYPSVQSIDVVEIDPDIVALNRSWMTNDVARDRWVNVHIGDAFTVKLDGEWDIAWHDVWDDLSSDNLSQSTTDKAAGDPDHSIARLNRRYARRVKWQGAWGHEFLKARRRQERNRWPW